MSDHFLAYIMAFGTHANIWSRGKRCSCQDAHSSRPWLACVQRRGWWMLARGEDVRVSLQSRVGEWPVDQGRTCALLAS